jgi:uncharacterized repeat protein (TIGR03803 family)
MRILVAIIAVLVLNCGLWAAQEQNLYSFGNAPDGNYPAASLTIDRNGNLYGTTLEGGMFGAGIVFQLSPANGHWVNTILYNFCRQNSCEDGSSPYGSLILDSRGNLYGTTYQGGAYGYGVAFELKKTPNGAWVESILHSFGNGIDGAGPLAGMIFDKAGNLYGTTSSGGASGTNCFAGCGTLFELSRATTGKWTESVLYNFCAQAGCPDGNSLVAGLVSDSAGNLYGTTAFGGTWNDGVVFELSPSGGGKWAQQVLHVFAGGSDGSDSHAGVVLVGGNLYGTTQFGGLSGNNGTVFQMVHLQNGQWQEKVLYSFCSQFSCSDGTDPLAGLIFDKSGNLYGTTFGGGASQWGTIFEVTKPKNGRVAETVLYSFTAAADGFNPHAGLVSDQSGNLFGVTYQGGTGGYGTIFEITP